MCHEKAVETEQDQNADGKEDGHDKHKDNVKTTHVWLCDADILSSAQTRYNDSSSGLVDQLIANHG